MSRRTLPVLGLAWCLVLTAGAGAALAQQTSLAEVARQEAARRKSVESSKRVYSNQDVNKGRPLTTGAVAKVPAANPAAEAAAPETEQGPPDQAAASARPATTADGQAPGATDSPDIVSLRTVLASATESSRDALGDVERATAAVLNLFDEAQRNAAVAKRDSRLADYRRYQSEIEAITRQIADLEAAHRKAQAAKKQ